MFFFFRRLSFKFFPCGASLLAVLEDNKTIECYQSTLGTETDIQWAQAAIAIMWLPIHITVFILHIQLLFCDWKKRLLSDKLYKITNIWGWGNNHQKRCIAQLTKTEEWVLACLTAMMDTVENGIRTWNCVMECMCVGEVSSNLRGWVQSKVSQIVDKSE